MFSAIFTKGKDKWKWIQGHPVKAFLKSWVSTKKKHLVLRAFQEYFPYIKPIVNQRWAKTGVPGEKPPDLPMQNLASHMYPEHGSSHSGERSNV